MNECLKCTQNRHRQQVQGSPRMHMYVEDKKTGMHAQTGTGKKTGTVTTGCQAGGHLQEGMHWLNMALYRPSSNVCIEIEFQATGYGLAR